MVIELDGVDFDFGLALDEEGCDLDGGVGDELDPA